MCRCKKTEPDAITVLFVLFAIIAIIAVIYIMFRMDSFGNERLQTSFIGIVATFIVIGNFAQMVEIRNETKKYLKELDEKFEDKTDNLTNELKRTNQTVDAILSGGGLDEVSIKEKYNYKQKAITLIEKAVFGRYYVVEFYEQRPVIVYVRGKMNNLKIDEIPFQEYIKRFTNKEDLDDMNSMLEPLGIK